jgi:hypothetical protein
MSAPDFVSHLIAAEDAIRSRASGSEIELKFDKSPDNRPKTAAWIIAERHGRCAELIVWSSGEVEFEAGTVGGGDLHQEHHDIATLAELDGLLAKLLSAV